MEDRAVSVEIRIAGSDCPADIGISVQRANSGRKGKGFGNDGFRRIRGIGILSCLLHVGGGRIPSVPGGGRIAAKPGFRERSRRAFPGESLAIVYAGIEPGSCRGALSGFLAARFDYPVLRPVDDTEYPIVEPRRAPGDFLWRRGGQGV